MSSARRRLERLEARHAPASLPADFPDWPLEDQLTGVADTLRFYERHHPNDPVRYPATDRELHLLGLLCAARGLGEDGGEHRFPSGLAVRLVRDGEHFLVDTPRQIRGEDLPEWTREFFERMDPDRQPKRDAWLHGDRHRAKKERERAVWHEEHGWEKPTPEHLVTWVTP